MIKYYNIPRLVNSQISKLQFNQQTVHVSFIPNNIYMQGFLFWLRLSDLSDAF